VGPGQARTEAQGLKGRQRVVGFLGSGERCKLSQRGLQGRRHGFESGGEFLRAKRADIFF